MCTPQPDLNQRYERVIPERTRNRQLIPRTGGERELDSMQSVRNDRRPR